MREAGRIVAETHRLLKQAIEPGVTTAELDRMAEEYIRSQGAVPSFKGYNGFPASICASVNEELVHGFPGPRKLKEGDIISIDIGAQYQGYHGDSAWTYPVGDISEEARRLLEVTEASLYGDGAEASSRTCGLYTDIACDSDKSSKKRDSRSFGNMSATASAQSCTKNRKFRTMAFPTGVRGLKPGMTLAIEPMVIVGERYVKTLDDNGLSSQWTDTVRAFRAYDSGNRRRVRNFDRVRE